MDAVADAWQADGAADSIVVAPGNPLLKLHGDLVAAQLGDDPFPLVVKSIFTPVGLDLFANGEFFVFAQKITAAFADHPVPLYVYSVSLTYTVVF